MAICGNGLCYTLLAQTYGCLETDNQKHDSIQKRSHVFEIGGAQA